MNHIYQNINGWFSFEKLYRTVVKDATDNSHFVEVGTWEGKSASYMAVEIINSNKKIKFDCVDTWKGSFEHQGDELVKSDTLYSKFLSNVDSLKHIINPIRLSSIDAAKLYGENSLDFVFIDAAHDYQNVKADINAWYPKVKSGGILAGHDYFSEWGDVVKAVDEFVLNNKYSLDINYNNCWGFIKK